MNRQTYLLLPLLLFFCLPLLGQQRNDRAPARVQQPAPGSPGGKLSDRVYFGGNLIFNFGSGNGYSEFTIGGSPLIGIKLFPGFSLGPRGTLIYSNVKFRQVGFDEVSESTLTWAAGAFARYRIIPQLFAHVEYELEEVPALYWDGSGNLVSQRFRRNNFYVGGGFYSGGPIGVEILALYNVINTTGNFYRSPFVLRFGVVAGF